MQTVRGTNTVLIMSTRPYNDFNNNNTSSSLHSTPGGHSY
jgi:hypothetical protein